MIEVRNMSLTDLKTALDWAAAEGWNPGLDDAEAFLKTDPNGFFMGWVSNTPVAAISVVRHSDSYGFLGLYLCHPDHRGQGYGWALWQVGLAYLEERTIGLDGVPAQQENYRKSGFSLSYSTTRYCGGVTGKGNDRFVPATPDMLPALNAFDTLNSGVERPNFSKSWFANTPTRKTLVELSGDKITSSGTIRTCRDGHKIGPLYAKDAGSAAHLLRALIKASSATSVSIDVPSANVRFRDLVAALGMKPAFTTARMYKGDPLEQDTTRIFGTATLELG